MDTNPLVPEVLYEDKDVLVINKPAGLLVHGIFDKGGQKDSGPTLTDWLSEKYPEVMKIGDKPEQRGGIVHRLDRETSGVMIIARKQKAFDYLKKLFLGRSIKKTYTALAWGRIHEKQGVIDKPISIVNGTVKRTVFKGRMPREAVTEYEVLGHYAHRHGKHHDEFTLVNVMPKTGRTHQIRVHFSAIGHALVGDKLYGKKNNLKFEEGEPVEELDRHFLHASALELKLPSGNKMKFEAPLAPDLEQVLKQLEVA